MNPIANPEGEDGGIVAPTNIETDGKEETVDDVMEHVVDITSYFSQAATSLTFQQPLLANESFNLQDSMAALELTDPTMDCCEIPMTPTTTTTMTEGGVSSSIESEGELSTKAASNNVAVSDRRIPPRKHPHNLSDTDLPPPPWDELDLRLGRAIALESFVRLNSLLGGSGVAESTYTCLYAHDSVLTDARERIGASIRALATASEKSPSVVSITERDVAQRAVYASTLMLVKLSETVRTIVQHADIYEEEDFVVGAFQFRFFPQIDPAEVRDTLILALDTIDEFISNSQTVRGKDPDAAVPSSDPEGEEDATVISLLLGFQLDFLDACTSLVKMTLENVRKMTTNAKSIVSSGVSRLGSLFDILSSSTRYGGARYDAELDADMAIWMSRAFDSNVNRRLLGNAPVRKVRFQTPLNSVSSMKTIMSELNWAVCDLLLKGSSLGRIKRMLNRVSKSSVNILGRSLIVLNLYFDDLLLGQHELGTAIAQHMKLVGAIPAALMNADFGQTLLARLGKPIYDTLKVLVLNRNRQRTYIEALMIKEWASLRREASAVDYCYHELLGASAPTGPAHPFVTNYVLSITVWLMEHYLGLGIELCLYHDHHDLAVAYWYSDFLLSSQLNITTAMKRAAVEQRVMEAKTQRAAEEENKHTEQHKHHGERRGKKKGKKGSNGSGKNKGSSKPQAPSAALDTPIDLEESIEFMMLGMRRTLCRGIVRCIAALNQAEILKPPVFEFTSHERRFEKRFDIFHHIQQPQPLTYSDFCKGSDFSSVTQIELLTSAAECFKATKTVLEKLKTLLTDIDMNYSPIGAEEIMNLTKVCVSNSIFLHRLTMLVKETGTAEGSVEFGFQFDKQYCSIKIT